MGRSLRNRLPVAACVLLAGLAFVGVALAAGHWKVKPTRAGKASAKAAVLRQTDFPAGDGTWTGHTLKPTLSTAFSCKSAYHPKQSDLIVTGSAEMDWTNGGLGLAVDSLALVFKTPKMPHLYYQRMVAASPALACLKTSAKKQFGSALDSLGVVSFPHVGSTSHDIRTVVTVAGGSGPTEVDFDEITIVKGHTVIMLEVESPQTLLSTVQPLELTLAKKVAARAK